MSRKSSESDALMLLAGLGLAVAYSRAFDRLWPAQPQYVPFVRIRHVKRYAQVSINRPRHLTHW